ncbi:hypothetical protein H2248_010450 [Termitomyces sp. 'cryptogamus']|nr:hypothetical protein H2248_010450 [Termitomyces sp. 'cryptogamus']
MCGLFLEKAGLEFAVFNPYKTRGVFSGMLTKHSMGKDFSCLTVTGLKDSTTFSIWRWSRDALALRSLFPSRLPLPDLSVLAPFMSRLLKLHLKFLQRYYAIFDYRTFGQSAQPIPYFNAGLSSSPRLQHHLTEKAGVNNNPILHRERAWKYCPPKAFP